MAKIWPVYEGSRPTVGPPWAELPLPETVSLLELRPDDFVTDLGTTPRFGDSGLDLSYRGFKHIVAEIERSDAKQTHRWKPGFYRSRIKPEDAFGRLIRHALATELGERNVIRVEHAPTTDWQGRDALRITVVIPPGATKRLQKGALDALVRLHERLREMQETRTPILEYATEAELAQSGGP